MADQSPPDWDKLRIRATKTLEALELTEDQLHAVMNVIQEYAYASVDLLFLRVKDTIGHFHAPGDPCITYVRDNCSVDEVWPDAR